jgi:hypothetical protein
MQPPDSASSTTATFLAASCKEVRMAGAKYEANYCTGYILGLSDQLFVAGEVWMDQITLK